MSKFKFSVGPWNVHTGADSYGPETRKDIPVEEKFKKFAEMGFSAIQFHAASFLLICIVLCLSDFIIHDRTPELFDSLISYLYHLPGSLGKRIPVFPDRRSHKECDHIHPIAFAAWVVAFISSIAQHFRSYFARSSFTSLTYAGSAVLSRLFAFQWASPINASGSIS